MVYIPIEMRRCVQSVWLASLLVISEVEAFEGVLADVQSLMQQQQWAEAYRVLAALDSEDPSDLGRLLFSKGVCQMELARVAAPDQQHARYEKALNYFSRCQVLEGSEEKPNLYQMRSVLRIGMCQQALKQYTEAYSSYQKFLLERNQLSDSYDHGSLYLNLAICAIRRVEPNTELAAKYLSEVVDERERWKVRESSLVMALLDLVELAFREEREETAWQCLQRLSELFSMSQEEVSLSAARVGVAASTALEEQQAEQAIAYLKVLPWIQEQDDNPEVDQSIVEYGLELYGRATSGTQSVAVYDRLIISFPDSTKRAEWEYLRVLAYFEGGDLAAGRAAMSKYLKKYCASQHKGELQALELSALFDASEFEQASKRAEDYLRDSKNASLRELASSVLAGCVFFQENYRECLAVVESAFAEFLSGEYDGQLSFYRAVSLARLGDAFAAREELEKLIKMPELASLHDFAQYELGVLDFEAASYQQVRERVQLLSQKREELSPQLGCQVELLLARTDALLRDRDLAEQRYLTALALAREAKLGELEQELLFFIVRFYGREKVAGEVNLETAKCLPYYEAFFEKFSDSEYAVQVAGAGMYAMQQAGEAERGIARLGQVLQSACEQGREAGVRDAAVTYLWAQLDAGEKLSQLRLRFLAEEVTVFSLVKLFALQEIYAEGYKQAYLSWGKKIKFDARQRALYAELQLQAEGQTILPYLHLALGDWLLKDGNFPQAAQVHFEIAACSQLLAHRALAELGVARCLRMDGAVDALKEAATLLDGLARRSSGNPELLEGVMFEQAEVGFALQQWDHIIGLTRRYLEQNDFNKNKSRVWFLLAKSYDEKGMVEDAIANYSRIFASFTRVLPVSAPSVERLSVLTWQRGKPRSTGVKADKQVAYELAHRYLTMTKDYSKWEKERPEVAGFLQQIQANVQHWEESGEVVSVEQMLREMRQGKR